MLSALPASPGEIKYHTLMPASSRLHEEALWLWGGVLEPAGPANIGMRVG